jgi:ABC-type transport system involved in multi-copper enzyme maturation permease subunit
MIRLIIMKELREIIGSAKFAASFGLCSVLILFAFVNAAVAYRTEAARYEAAQKENLKSIEGLTDWESVTSTRIFLPPDILSTLVGGIANDIGRTTVVHGRGEPQQEDSRYGDEPMYALFRFLDLQFIFQVVLSLFAILFTYDAICGEKERGTLALAFANPLARHAYLSGKLLGVVGALVIPLIVPLLLGALIFIAMGIPLSADQWIRLGMITGTGILYVGVFLTLGIAVSAMTSRSSYAFLVLLALWIMFVLIVPRGAILITGRAVDVPSVDEIGAKKAELNRQLWTEDREKMSRFQPSAGLPPEKIMAEFQKFMSTIADDREKKVNALADRLNEERANRQAVQQSVAFGIARVSPSTCFALAASRLAGTGLGLLEHYRREALAYQQSFARFMLAETGTNPGGGLVFRIVTGNGEKPAAINPRELPPFVYHPLTLSGVLPGALPDVGLLVAFCLTFFAIAHVVFLRYDLR